MSTKIAYCLEGFYNHGGMERVVSVKANWLAEHGYDITIIVASQREQAAAFTLNSSIKFVDLQCNLLSLKSSYKDELTQHLSNHTYDIVISTGGLELLFLWKIKDCSHKIVEFHFAWNRFFVMSNSYVNKTKAIWQTARQISCAAKYERVILLTNTDKRFYRRFISNTCVIPNPVTIKPGAISDCKSKNAIAIGRLDYQKGFDLLIKSWQIVADKHPDWHLNIFGVGKEHKRLTSIIDSSGLNGLVFLRGHSSDIGKEFVHSSINICPSRSEGFSLSIMEAAWYGVPSIAFNCIAGPSELITMGVSGIIVNPVGNIKGLANAICELIDNDIMRKSMSIESHKISYNFRLDSIIHKWELLFSHLTKQTN